MKSPLSGLLRSLRRRLSGHTSPLQDAGDPLVSKLVDSILRDAAQRRASEIQIGWWPEADLGPKSEFDRVMAEWEDGQEAKVGGSAGRVFAVRYRIAAELNTAMILPHPLYRPVVARLKEMAGLASAAHCDQGNSTRQANQNAPRGRISREFVGRDGPKVLADFDVAIVAEDQEEKVLLSVTYSESQAT